MEFRIFGGVEASINGQPIALGYARLRSVLAVLLIEAKHTVSVDQLVERVWGNHRLPARPRNAVQHSVTMLRRALAGTPDVAIARQPGGYLIDIDPETVDMHRFRALIARARVADDEHAAPLFEQALALCRGEPCPGTDTPWFNTVRAALVEQRHAAQLDFTDVLLRRGRHAERLAELADQVRLHPLDERLAGQYMLTLYRSGRQAEALEHHQMVRVRLGEQLGADPSPPLQRLYHQILTADPALAAPAGPGVAGNPRRLPVPRQLPAAPRPFAGRVEVLNQLRSHGQAGYPAPIWAISGAGGIGKTWLALHWAHQHLDRFPDGQLHVNLRGFGPSGTPVSPQTAIAGFLDALVVDPAAIPKNPEAQVGLYRSLVAGKRMLIMLDNAADGAQVTPLLPGSPTCTVLITSRRRLTGLIAAHGATGIDLDVLSDTEAIELLTCHLGADRLAAEPDAVTGLVRHCAGLPLALGITAARATVYPDFPLRVLADELRDRTRRLDALNTGDLTMSLPTVLSWSCQHLSRTAATVFGLVAMVSGPDIDPHGVASLAGLAAAQARRAVRELEDTHLMHQYQPGRFRMHDLIRLYAMDYAQQNQSEEALRAAGRRFVDHYLHTTHAAELLIDPPPRPPISLGQPVAGCLPEPLPDQAAALNWLDREHANLLVAQQNALDQGWYTPVWQLAWLLDIYHYRRGRLQDALAVWQAALTAAEHLDDPVTQALAHRRIGYACARVGRHADALDHLQQALAHTEQADDRSGQGHSHYIIARAWEQLGDERRALNHANRATRLYRELNKPAREARALGAASGYYARLGHYQQAREQGTKALAMFREHRDRDGEGSTLIVLGQVAHRTGQHNQAIEYFRQALDTFRSIGNTYHEAETLDQLAETHLALRQPGPAQTAWRQALKLYQVQYHIAEAGRVQQKIERLDGVPDTSRGSLPSSHQ